MIRIGINGFGRIGKNFLRAILQDANALEKIKVAVVNIGPGKIEDMAYAFKYDTLLGTYPADVEMQGDFLVVNGYRIRIIAEIDRCNS